MTRPTASSLDRASACPASHALPGIRTAEPEYTTRGRVIHSFLHNAHGVGRAYALALVPAEYREACAAIDLDALPVLSPDAYAAEVAMAFDVASLRGRILGAGIDRDYRGLRPTEIPGTADLVGVAPDRVVVIDYKTGWGDKGSAADSLQLAFYGLAAASAYKRENATVALLHIRDDGSWRFDSHDLDAMDLDVVETDLIQIVRAVRVAQDRVDAGERLDVTVGAHCDYCPAVASCPAHRALVSSIVTDPTTALDGLIGALTPELAGEALARVRAAGKFLETVQKALRVYARSHPIPLPDGKVWGPVTVPTDRVADPDKVVDVLCATYGEDVARDAVKLVATKGDIVRAVRAAAVAGGKKPADLEREALAALRAAGAIVSEPVEKFEARRAPVVEGVA